MRDLETIHEREAVARRVHAGACPALPRGPWGCGHFAPPEAPPVDRATPAGIVATPAPLPSVDTGAILTLYIGSDNRTGARIGPATLARILGEHGFPGWTVADAAGVWQGTAEGSTVLTVLIPAPVGPDAPARARALASAVARAHRQEAVGWALVPALVGFADPRDTGPRALAP